MIFVHLFNDNFGDNHVSLFLLVKNNGDRKRKILDKNII